MSATNMRNLINLMESAGGVNAADIVKVTQTIPVGEIKNFSVTADVANEVRRYFDKSEHFYPKKRAHRARGIFMYSTNQKESTNASLEVATVGVRISAKDGGYEVSVDHRPVGGWNQDLV